MAELGASKVDVREVEPPVRIVTSAATAVAGMVGVAERGPIGSAVRVGSWEEYARMFGGFIPGADLPHAVLGFFQNGGRVLHVVRTAHFQDPDDAASITASAAIAELLAAAVTTAASVVGTVGPFTLLDGDVLAVAVDAAAPVICMFNGAPARLATTAAGPFLLADGMTLEIAIDGAAPQTVAFRGQDFAVITQATAAELATVLTAGLVGAGATVTGAGAVEISTTSAGRASQVQIVGGTAVAALLLAGDTAQGTGSVDRLSAVTIAEIDALLLAAAAGARAELGQPGQLLLRTVSTGPQARLQVQAGTTQAFGLDLLTHTGSTGVGPATLHLRGRDPGSYANRLTATVRSGAGATFDVLITEAARTRESFLALSMDPAVARYAPTIINHPRTGSRLIQIEDAGLAGRPPPAPQSVALTQGADGLAGLSDLDFLGSSVARSGLRGLDAVAELAIVALPGRGSAVAHEGLLSYCEVVRRGLAFAILDAEAGMTADDVVAYVTGAGGIEGRSEFGAVYWPRVRVTNPNPRALGPAEDLIVPPSGHIAGVYARTDGTRDGGVYEAPAGVDVGRLAGVLGAETAEVHDENARDLVFPRRVNPIRGRYIDGARTLKATGNFPSVPERRGAIYIARSISAGLDRVRHRNNTPELRAEVHRAVFQFLLSQMNVGAFATRDPRTAFFVDVSDAINPPSSVLDGKLRLRVGLATAKPAEFVIVELSQDMRALEAELANAEA